MTMKTKILFCFLLSHFCFSVCAQFNPAGSQYAFPQFTTGPLSTGNTWFVLNQGGTNGYNLAGTNFFRFVNAITPSAYKLATLDQLDSASNSLVVQIAAAGGLSFTPQYGTLNLSNWSTLDTNILSGLGGGSSAWADITGKPTTIGGYGITDYNSLGDARWQPLDAELTAWAALATSAKQDADADLTDLADGSLTGSKVGSGISGDNVTSGTIADARVASTIARDSEVTAAVAITASGFNGNLTTTDDTIQELAQAVDDLVLGGSSDYDTNTFTGTGPLVRGTNANLHSPTFSGTVTINEANVANWRSTTVGNSNAAAVFDPNGLLTNSPNLTAWSALATSAKQDADADLTDLADGSLTGSKVGTGISGDNITSGTVASARIDSAQATDAEVATAVAINAAGFNGNLTTSDDTIQEVAQKVDDLSVGGGGVDSTLVSCGLVAATMSAAVNYGFPIGYYGTGYPGANPLLAGVAIPYSFYVTNISTIWWNYGGNNYAGSNFLVSVLSNGVVDANSTFALTCAAGTYISTRGTNTTFGAPYPAHTRLGFYLHNTNTGFGASGQHVLISAETVKIP